jgi:hypothetical protein
MNRLAVALLLLAAAPARASLEHRAEFGAAPSEKRLSTARGCFREIARQGCRHPREGQEEFEVCLRRARRALGTECRAFFGRLYGTDDP